MLKLHLGCGGRIMGGWVNIDMPNGWFPTLPDLEHDLTEPLPYEDGTVDEIFSSHVFEHFERWTADKVLDDWVRVLKPGGLISLEMPCLDKIVEYMAIQRESRQPLEPRMSILGLYGDPSHQMPSMMHRWCYSQSEIMAMFNRRGLGAKITPTRTHIAARDMRIEGVKRD